MLRSKTVLSCLLFTVIVGSWPFFNFPLTDGDIVNWAKVSYDMLQTGTYFSAIADQGHGPLMALGGVLSLKLFGTSFLGLNFFNLLSGLICVVFTYVLSMNLFQKEASARLATFIFTTSIAAIYLTRTPMYDWPATAAYLGFVTGYTRYLFKQKTSDFVLALIAVGLGSLSRFSICMGLAGIYVILSNLILKRSLILMIRDGILVATSVGLFNSYWLMQQQTVQGESFLKTFIYDNTGRYVKSTRPNAKFRADFYGFPLYVLIGFLPYTIAMVASFFQKSVISRFKSNRSYLLVLASFLPCLLLFSFSGHTKLARYIAYVFPFMSILLADFLVNYDLKSEIFRKRCKRIMLVMVTALLILLVQQTLHFFDQAQTSILFVLSAFILVFGLIGIGYTILTREDSRLLDAPESFLIRFAVVYLFFFSVLAYEYDKAPFLVKVKEGILYSITNY